MFKNFDLAIQTIKTAYERATGSGFYLILFFILFIYIFIQISKEDKYLKVFFRWYPIAIILIILNPLFYNLTVNFVDSDVYWRTFWCLPIGIIIAYGFTIILKKIKKENIQKLAFIIVVCLIAISGKFIYTKEFFEKVNNPYKVPDMALEIIEKISNDDEEYKKVAGPEEIIVYMRQIDGTVLTEDYRTNGEYGRELIISKINRGEVFSFANECISVKCNYVVIERDVKVDASLVDYGYKPVLKNEKYALYKIDFK